MAIVQVTRVQPPLAKRLADVLMCVLVLGFGAQLAWWTWHFLAPRPIARQSVSDAIDLDAARRLFGATSAPTSSTASSTSAGIRLKGVYAIDGRTLSAAVLNTGSKNDIAVRTGEEILPGVSLAEVRPDHVVVSRSGVRERVDLDVHVARAATKNPRADGFRLKVASSGVNSYSLSRSELNVVLQDPRQLSFLGSIGAHPSGGVRLEQAPPGSLPDKLGLREGDVVKIVNGQPINSPGDLARIYQQFGTLAQIRAEVTRSGVPMLITYQIQP